MITEWTRKVGPHDNGNGPERLGLMITGMDQKGWA